MEGDSATSAIDHVESGEPAVLLLRVRPTFERPARLRLPREYAGIDTPETVTYVPLRKWAGGSRHILPKGIRPSRGPGRQSLSGPVLAEFSKQEIA